MTGIIVGEKNPMSKLTDSKAEKILLRLEKGESQADLAREYRISSAAIYRLKKGLSWRHIKRCR